LQAEDEIFCPPSKRCRPGQSGRSRFKVPTTSNVAELELEEPVCKVANSSDQWISAVATALAMCLLGTLHWEQEEATKEGALSNKGVDKQDGCVWDPLAVPDCGIVAAVFVLEVWTQQTLRMMSTIFFLLEGLKAAEFLPS